MTKENIERLVFDIKDIVDTKFYSRYRLPSRVTEIYDYEKAIIFDCDDEYPHEINLGKLIVSYGNNKVYFIYSLKLDNGQEFIYSSPVFIDGLLLPNLNTEVKKLTDSLETFLKLDSHNQEVNE